MLCMATYVLFIDRGRKYKKWFDLHGAEASQRCIADVGRFYCMQTFPPCEEADQYAAYPCRSACESLYSICHSHLPFECPLDGPTANATEESRGIHANSNNDIHSCFNYNASITPYPFLLYFLWDHSFKQPCHNVLLTDVLLFVLQSTSSVQMVLLSILSVLM